MKTLRGWVMLAVATCVLGGMGLTVTRPARADFPLVFISSPPLYTLRIHAIKVADDNGMRPAQITPAQVKQWVDKANQIFADSAAGIQFQFDPNPNGLDWETRNNTALNNGPDPATANALAAEYPGKIVVFFRYGPDKDPTGNGHSYPPQSGIVTNYVAMPGFNNTSVRVGKDANNQWIWKQNIWQLAHDIGHYLGLPHTFPGWHDGDTDTPAKAAAYIASHGGTASALDGDGLADTPPEAGTAFYLNQGWDPCVGHDSYTISGTYWLMLPFGVSVPLSFSHTFTPDRHNVMSYFACELMRFTPDQVERMHETLQLPVRRHLIQAPCPSNFHGLPADQFQNCFNYWVHRGLWPVTLSASQQNGQIFMSGSFQPGASRPVRHLITAQQYEQDFLTFRGQGFRPAHVNILNTAAGLRFTAIWTPIDGQFESWWGMTPEAYEARWQQLRSQGYLQTDLFVYQDNGLKFAATWVKKSFTDYASYWGMTAEQYNARFVAFWGQGLRVTHFVAYPTSAGTRYAAIWEKRPGGWAHYYDMTSAEYQQKYNTLAAQGHQLYQIHALGDRYSAVWYRP